MRPTSRVPYHRRRPPDSLAPFGDFASVHPSPASHSHLDDRDGGFTPPVVSAGRRDCFSVRENVTHRMRVTVVTQRWSFRALGLEPGPPQKGPCPDLCSWVPRPGNRLASHRRLDSSGSVTSPRESRRAVRPGSRVEPVGSPWGVHVALLAAGTAARSPGTGDDGPAVWSSASQWRREHACVTRGPRRA